MGVLATAAGPPAGLVADAWVDSSEDTDGGPEEIVLVLGVAGNVGRMHGRQLFLVDFDRPIGLFHFFRLRRRLEEILG